MRRLCKSLAKTLYGSIVTSVSLGGNMGLAAKIVELMGDSEKLDPTSYAIAGTIGGATAGLSTFFITDLLSDSSPAFSITYNRALFISFFTTYFMKEAINAVSNNDALDSDMLIVTEALSASLLILLQMCMLGCQNARDQSSIHSPTAQTNVPEDTEDKNHIELVIQDSTQEHRSRAPRRSPPRFFTFEEVSRERVISRDDNLETETTDYQLIAEDSEEKSYSCQ